MSTYIWCEDSGSGYQFWKAIFAELYPSFFVESKTNNTRLRQAAEHLGEDGNDYYLLIDTAVGNSDVLRELKRLNAAIAGMKNIHLINVHSFEATLLSFERLEQWVFAEIDDLKQKRQKLLQARRSFIKLISSQGEPDDLSEIKALLGGSKEYNTEQLAAKLLFGITRNTGFETDKSKLGPCFVANCCDWNSRQKNDLCGLDQEKPNAKEKIKQLVFDSLLKSAFTEAGLL